MNVGDHSFHFVLAGIALTLYAAAVATILLALRNLRKDARRTARRHSIHMAEQSRARRAAP